MVDRIITISSGDAEERQADQETLSHLDDPLSLSRARKSEGELAKYPTGVSRFYRAQNELIDQLLTPPDYREEGEEDRQVKVKIAIYGSFMANVFLFALQLCAAIFSQSLSLLATTADAFMDLMSSLVLVLSARAASRSHYLAYPAGGAKYETAGIIVFSTLMATLAIQLIIESIRRLTAGDHEIDLGVLSIACIASSIFVKLLLYIYCQALSQYPSVKVFAQDHLNDIMFNSMGIAFSVMGQKLAWWLDPMGAMIIALLVIRSWSGTAKEHIQLVVGKTASPEFLQRLTYIAMTHDHRVQKVDTIRAYHSGERVFVEVDIVLPPEMQLREAHDIGEALQVKLEKIPDVERAFVHIDWEYEHRPEHSKSS